MILPSTELRIYQKSGVEFLVGRPRRMLADDMGLGKTLQAVAATEERRGKKPVLVVTLNSIRRQWAEEVHTRTDRRAEVLEGSTAERAHQLGETSADYVIVNYESMRLLGDALVTRQWDTVIFDESHKLKNRDAAVSKAAKRLTYSTAHVIELSGTPIFDTPPDLWHQLHLLDPRMFKSYWRFINSYCSTYDNGFGTVIGPVIHPELMRDDLAPYILRREKSEELGLPPKMPAVNILVDLERPQRVQYDQMAKEMKAQIGDQLVYAGSTLTQLMRLRQIATSPSLAVGDYTLLQGPKAGALLDLIDSTGDKIVVFSDFSRTILAAFNTLTSHHINCEYITGDIADDERVKRIRYFRSDPDCRVLLATVGVGGVGLNLVEANVVVQLDLDWSPGANNQAIDRVHRIGQTKTVFVYRILARDTIDEGMAKVVDNKSADIRRSLRVSDLLA